MEHTQAFWAHNSEDGGFLSPRIRRVFTSCAKVAQFLPGLKCSNVNAVFPFVPFPHMLFRGDAFQIIRSVVVFHSIDVVNMFGRIKVIQPTLCHNTVHEPSSAQYQVPLRVRGGHIRHQLSENFSAARNGVKMVKHAVFNAVHRKADHVGDALAVNFYSYHKHRGMSNG